MDSADTENLFRAQAIKALSQRLCGRPICLMPRPWLWLILLVILLFVATLAVATSTEYTRRETARGWILSSPGVIRISNPTAALVTDVVRLPGDHVQSGDALIYLSTDGLLSNGHGKSAKAILQLNSEAAEIDAQRALLDQQQAIESESLQKQLDELNVEIAALREQQVVQRGYIALVTDKLERLKSAAKTGAVRAWDVLQEQENLSTQRQALGRLRQETARQLRAREVLISQRAGLPVEFGMRRSVLTARRFQLSRQIAEHELRQLSVLSSPVSGVVDTIEVQSGNSVAPGQLLVTVIPEHGRLVADVYVPSSAIGFIRTGQDVQISYDAFPREKFGVFSGTVARVSDSVLLPHEIPQTFHLQEASYRLRVHIDANAVSTSEASALLRPGMLLGADIELEHRDLIDWLLEPLRLRRGTSG